MSREKTVFVVDDEPDMRSALTRVFRSEGLDVVAFGSAQEFLEAYAPGSGGCVVLDLMMPGMTGLQLQQQLRARAIEVPLIFLTGTADVRVAVEAMRAGAADFLEKPFENDQLVQRVRIALHVGGQARESALRRSEIEQRLAQLTPREREVMDLVVAGNSNKQVADTLSLSARTVEVHRAHIMEKMGANTLADLVRMALAAKF